MSIKHISTLLFLFFYSNYFFPQSAHNITGLISDNNNQGIPYVNVLLLKKADSTLVKGTISNDNGRYKFDAVGNGNYLVMGSYIGFQTAYSKSFSLSSDHQVETIVLKEGEQLDEVVVEGTKPLYQQKIDRMVINVENSIVSAGGTALEVLERSPGIVVNRQNNSISVVGKEGVVVMINGKTSYVPASALVQMLDGMSADNIGSIEVITTPPANLDAEGNAGFVNIVMKQRTDLGLNGSYSLSNGHGNAFVTSNNINFNYRKNKINVFGNYSFSWDGTDQVFAFYKQFKDSNENIITTDTYSDRDATQRNHNLRLGLDFQASEKTITGFLVTAYSNKWTMDAINKTSNTENGLPSSYVELLNDEINLWRHFGVNYNFKHNFTDDQFISLDLDYLYYKDDNPNNYFNTYYDENNVFDKEEYSRSGKVTPIKTWVGKFDYSTNIGEKLKFETGVKGTSSKFNNDVSVENNDGSTWVIDPTLTNVSDLNESVFAAYGSIDYTINDSWSAKFGLRYEYTNTQLDTDTEGVVVDRQYGQFFPSIYFNKKWNDNLNMNLSYSRRITRPTFNDMAPFVIFIDPTTFFSGNPSLQPAISNSFKYDINYKSYVFSVQYTNQDSSIARFQERYDEDNDRLVFEATNLDFTKTFSITAGFPLKLNDWWRIQNNLNFVSQKVRGDYNGNPRELQLGNFSANTTSSLKFSDSFSGEITAFYTSKGLFGIAEYDSFYRINIGIQKKLSEKWGSLRFSANDIFDSFQFKGGTNIPEESFVTRNLFDFSAPTFLLTYTRNFGNSKLKSSRQRGTGAEEERQRVDN